MSPHLTAEELVEKLRHAVTAAAWAFPLLTVWIGVSYLAPTSTFGSPAYQAVARYTPTDSMRWWAGLFLAVAAIKLGFLAARRQPGYMAAMSVGAGLYGFWAGIFVFSLFRYQGISWSAPAWPTFVAAMHLIFLAALRYLPLSLRTPRLESRPDEE